MNDLLHLGPVPDWLVIDAVRYAIGRRSVQPAITSEWLIGVWGKLPESVRSIVTRDIEAEFNSDDLARKMVTDGRREPGCYPLGMDCDRECWDRVRRLWTT